MFLLLLLGVTKAKIHAQSIDDYSNLLRNLSTSLPLALHHANLSAVHWTSPSLAKNKYYSLSMQAAFSSTNISRILFGSEPKGDVLIEEKIGLGAALQFRTKQWQLPIDVGVQFAPIFGENFGLLNLGIDTMHALFQQDGYIPNISIGLLYAYSWLYFNYEIAGLEYSGIDKAESDVRIKVDTIQLNLSTHVHSIATRLQASHKWNFIEPYVGLEPALFVSIMNITTDSGVYVSEDAGETYKYHTSFSELTYNFLQAKGFLFSETLVQTALRCYIGTSFSIRNYYIDIQAGLEPISWLASGSLGFRIVW